MVSRRTDSIAHQPGSLRHTLHGVQQMRINTGHESREYKIGELRLLCFHALFDLLIQPRRHRDGVPIR